MKSTAEQHLGLMPIGSASIDFKGWGACMKKKRSLIGTGIILLACFAVVVIVVANLQTSGEISGIGCCTADA
ncbi:hypothetical protein [Paenibacillus campinasensis]|uniref:hypothetical protein n=1 Tax=Paenibacillus campinasensis TaxID=66347 RepID=UPI0018C23FB1|nr:hypothetical protein [Paenibacillus campinasensis]